MQYGRHRSQDLIYSAHETQISKSEIFDAKNNTQALRYSTLDTQISRPEIFIMADTELSIRDIQHGRKVNFDQESLHVRHRLETLRYSIRLTQIRSIEVFIHRHRLETLSFLACVTQT